jgi:putative integral membrane protein (TIGR02587 family)
VLTNQDTLKEYGRGIAGGLLFSLSMLYTLEFWQAGFVFKPYQLLIYLIVSFFLLYAYNKYAGFNREDNFKENILESFEEMGIAFLLVSFILFISGRIHSDLSLYEIQGKIIIQAVNVAIGISIGKKQLALPDDEDDFEEEDEEENSDSNSFFCNPLIWHFAARCLLLQILLQRMKSQSSDLKPTLLKYS